MVAVAVVLLPQSLPGALIESKEKKNCELNGMLKMAACPSGVQIAPRNLTRGIANETRRIGASRRITVVAANKSLKSNGNAMMMVKAIVVEETSASAATLSEQESMMLRRADSYFATDSRPIVLFDGVCNFCNAGVNFVLDNDPEGRLRLAALQSEAGKALLLRAGRSSNDLSSLVLVEKDGSYIKSEGVLRTALYLANVLPPLGSLGLLFPLFFRDFVYDNVANNRYSILGRRDQCRVSDPRFNDRFVV